jgi:hypothetical protein
MEELSQAGAGCERLSRPGTEAAAGVMGEDRQGDEWGKRQGGGLEGAAPAGGGAGERVHESRVALVRLSMLLVGLSANMRTAAQT